MPKYPAQIDNNTSLPSAVNNFTPVTGSVYNKLRDAIIAIESELGANASGVYGDVKSRIEALEGVVSNLDIISLSGDLGGTLTSPKVIGIQGKPVSTVAPDLYDVLSWNGIAWEPAAFPLPPGNNYGETLIWNGANYVPGFLTQDEILPGYQFNITSGSAQFVIVGQSYQQGFNVSYSDAPDLAVLTDDQGMSEKDVTTAVTNTNFCISNNTYTKNTYNATVTYTITATRGYVTKTATNTLTWTSPMFFGTGAAGQTLAAFLSGPKTQILQNTKNTTFTETATGLNKIYFACRSGYGTITFTVGGFVGGFTQTYSSIPYTNIYGFTENYDLYESDFAGLGTIIVQTS